MKINEIYKKFEIPPNLVEHMLTVARVVSSIKKHWAAEDIDWILLKHSALLHDIGNIVKFRFNENPELIGKESVDIKHWKRVQKHIIDNYGTDDHIATGNMLKEIGVTGKLWDVIQNKSFSNAVEVAKGDDWYTKILLYADMRVMPFGVATLEDRLADVQNRMPQYVNRSDFGDLLDAARNIEKQISEKLDLQVSEIDWGSMEETDEEFLSVSV